MLLMLSRTVSDKKQLNAVVLRGLPTAACTRPWRDTTRCRSCLARACAPRSCRYSCTEQWRRARMRKSQPAKRTNAANAVAFESIGRANASGGYSLAQDARVATAVQRDDAIRRKRNLHRAHRGVERCGFRLCPQHLGDFARTPGHGGLFRRLPTVKPISD